MQSNNLLTRERPTNGKPVRTSAAADPKEITVRTLSQLKAKLYAHADVAMKQNPTKAEIIQKAVDRDASRLVFAINMVQVKM